MYGKKVFLQMPFPFLQKNRHSTPTNINPSCHAPTRNLPDFQHHFTPKLLSGIMPSHHRFRIKCGMTTCFLVGVVVLIFRLFDLVSCCGLFVCGLLFI